MKYFFEEIITLEKTHEEVYINELIKSSVHHYVLDEILKQLENDADKEKLLELVAKEENKTVLEVLEEKIKDFSVKLAKMVKDAENEIERIVNPA